MNDAPTWTIERAGAPHAVAVAGPGATVQDLAGLIGLDATEAGAWLRPLDGPEPQPGRRFHIPNTVVMIWAGEMGWFGQRVTAWRKDISWLEERGFHVVEVDHREMSDYEALARIRDYGHREGKHPAALHGLIVTAHGDPTYFTAKTKGDSDWVITYEELDEAIEYGLALVLI